MERLTDYHVGKKGAYMICSGNCCGGLCEDCEKFSEIVNRLAAYEDTGLEPEEILTGKELAEVACAMNLLKEYQAIGPIDHMRDLAQAEKDGRLVVLPVKIGDKIFHLFNGKIEDLLVSNVIYRDVGGYACKILVECIPFRRSYWREDFGKAVFLTREEAEAALKKEVNNEAERKTGRYRPKD